MQGAGNCAGQSDEEVGTGLLAGIRQSCGIDVHLSKRSRSYWAGNARPLSAIGGFASPDRSLPEQFLDNRPFNDARTAETNIDERLRGARDHIPRRNHACAALRG